MKEDNRFIEIFRKKAKTLTLIRNFLTIIGIVSIFLFLVEFYLIVNPLDEKEIIVHEDILGSEGNFYFRQHPYLDYTQYLQETVNPCTDYSRDVIKIYMYGGSTMHGESKDESIPHYLSAFLCDAGYNVEVKNFGQAGYVSTQEMIKFILQIREGNVPDIAVFYDGFNDIHSSFPGYPHMHLTEEVFDFYFYHREFPLSRTTNSIYRFLWERGIVKDRLQKERGNEVYFDYPYRYSSPSDEFDYPFETRGGLSKREKYEGILQLYLENSKIIDSLEESYQFNSLFYWQPTLVTKKNLSEEEKDLIENRFYDLLRDYNIVKDIIDYNLSRSEKIIDLREVFNDYHDEIFVDGCHKLPAGNRIIAERIGEDIVDLLN